MTEAERHLAMITEEAVVQASFEDIFTDSKFLKQGASLCWMGMPLGCLRAGPTQTPCPSLSSHPPVETHDPPLPTSVLLIPVSSFYCPNLPHSPSLDKSPPVIPPSYFRLPQSPWSTSSRPSSGPPVPSRGPAAGVMPTLGAAGATIGTLRNSAWSSSSPSCSATGRRAPAEQLPIFNWLPFTFFLSPVLPGLDVQGSDQPPLAADLRALPRESSFLLLKSRSVPYPPARLLSYFPTPTFHLPSQCIFSNSKDVDPSLVQKAIMAMLRLCQRLLPYKTDISEPLMKGEQ